MVCGEVSGAVAGQENKKIPSTLSGTIHCLVESCLNASYKYAEALQAHFNYCIGERGGEGRGGYGGREGTVKLKQMPEKEPPYVLVFNNKHFGRHLHHHYLLFLPLLVSSI